MAKEPEKPARRNILTGAAQPVTNSVERARGFLKDREEPHAPPSKRQTFRRTKPESDDEKEPPGEDEGKPAREGEVQ
jgi:hypothetical protein